MSRKTILMTEGAITGPLIEFILPLLGSSLFQQLYNTVDFLYVGNLLTKSSAAAVGGASGTLVSCIINLFVGLSIGTSVVSAQAVGAGDPDEAERALHSSLVFAVSAGLALAAAGMLLAPSLLTLLNTPASTMPEAILYLRIYLISVPMMVFYNISAGELRALGDSRTPFMILVVCGILNVVADALFMIVIPLGVAGVAMATALAQSLSAFMAARALSGGGLPVRLSAGKLRVDARVLGKVLRIGVPSGIQSMIITFSNVIVQYYINAFGETAVAAFATYSKVGNLVYQPILAFGQASTTFSGQNAGAGKPRRILRGTLVILAICTAVTLVLAGLILGFPLPVHTLFIRDMDVVSCALEISTICFSMYWLYPLLEVLGGALRGMGYAITSMTIIVSNMCVLRIALLAVFSEAFHAVRALAWVYPITWASTSLCFIITFAIAIKKRLC